MPSTDSVKLYRSPSMSGHWIGDDKRGGLVTWPAEEGGWAQRTPYTGPRRGLEEVEPALARRTGWPGAGGGRLPRAASGKPSGKLTIRVTDEERSDWTEAAGERPLSDWVRDAANESAARKKRERGGPAR